MKRFVIFAAVLVFLSLSFANIAPQSAHDLFQKALATERAEGNLEEAIALYQRVVKKAKDESLGAKAQLRIGMCYEKLGLEEAQKAYQKVIDNYPQQTEVVKMAKEKLEILLRAKTLVEKGNKEYKVTMIHSGSVYPDSLSPDGKKLALSNSHDWDIWIKDVATEEQVKLTDETNMIREMVWSPDSRMIAFGDNLHNVYVVSSKGGPSRVIIEADPESVKSKDAISISGWTSDSKKIVFQIPSRGLFAIPA
ncbi:tetratricopeptide repeat protein [bacterium]|nr:tetratricopeptide repeat protein [bacterium]